MKPWDHVPGVVARVGGEDVVPGVGEVEVRDPADHSVLTTIGAAGSETVARAVEAAEGARLRWGGALPEERAAALRAIAEDLRGATDTVARVITAETGKLLPEAVAEVGMACRYLEWFASSVPSVGERVGTAVVTRHPVGVVAAVTTWNFPLSIPVRKFAAALAAGCPVVLKPSPLAPLTAHVLVRLCEPHLPAGTVGLVHGGAAQARALARAPQVRAVSFTGSTESGVDLARRLAPDLTRSLLELGGRAPAIVLPDADPEQAADVVMQAKFRNNGASCIAANNVFVHQSLLGCLMSVLADRVRTLRPGDPRDALSTLGPMRTPELARAVEGLAERAEADGCPVVWGSAAQARSECYTRPVLVHADRETLSWGREVYGPLLQVRGFRDVTAVVTQVNSWRRGLGGYVVGVDVDRATEVARQLRIGLVGIGTGSPNTSEVPFGGFDLAGWGREGAVAGLDPFLEYQSITYGV